MGADIADEVADALLEAGHERFEEADRVLDDVPHQIRDADQDAEQELGQLEDRLADGLDEFDGAIEPAFLELVVDLVERRLQLIDAFAVLIRERGQQIFARVVDRTFEVLELHQHVLLEFLGEALLVAA